MTKAVVNCFILPLSACFRPAPGQNAIAGEFPDGTPKTLLDLFLEQLRADLAPYSEVILSEAAKMIRRNHKYPTWPTIAECMEAVWEAAREHYKPVEQPKREKPEPSEEQRKRMIRRFDALLADLSQTIVMDKPRHVLPRGLK